MRIDRLLVATKNPGKVREFAHALEPIDIQVFGMDALSDRSEIDETGDTFLENAKLKAESYSLRTDMAVLADDSGLEVDALRGEPGVHSARYGGAGLDDLERNKLLLRELSKTTDPAKRTARFRCVIAVAREGDTLATFEGVVEGRITEEPRGENGFGYDPLFYHPPSGSTTAELTPGQKQLISHRGQAIRAFLDALRGGDPRLNP